MVVLVVLVVLELMSWVKLLVVVLLLKLRSLVKLGLTTPSLSAQVLRITSVLEPMVLILYFQLSLLWVVDSVVVPTAAVV
jgi:hypothetical protein